MKLLNIDEERIKQHYYIIDALIQKCIVENSHEAKEYIGYIIYHGVCTEKELGIYYADYKWDYDEYEEEGEEYELYQYARHKKIHKDFENDEPMDDSEIYIKTTKLGKAMLSEDNPYDFEEFFRIYHRVFEFSKNNVVPEDDEHYIDPNIAEYCYISVKEIFDTVGDVDYAVNMVYQNNNNGEVA